MKLRSKFGINIALVSVLVFVGIAAFVSVSTRSLMVDEAEHTVKSVVKATVGRIDRLMTSVESVAMNSGWIVKEHLNEPDYMYRITRELVENNQFIVGSAVAFEPNFFPGKGLRFSPYSCVTSNNVIKSFPLLYDYHNQEWYSEPVAQKRARWCEPYFDEGGGETLMSTFSVPIFNATGHVFAVLTSDISLERLTHHVASIRPYPQSYAILRSEKGAVLVPPPKDAQLSGGKAITICERADNGWTVEIVCPIEEILSGAKKLTLRLIAFSVAGLALIFFLSRFYTSRLQRATAERQRIDSELAIASSIQSGILPSSDHETIAGGLRPAREIGGDLYDYLEKDGKIYFIIGDASGKGVPAALFAFMVGVAFRLGCEQGLAPDEIIRHANSVLSKGNDLSMFVTAFAGVLDTTTGELIFCNAGHNPPVVITPSGKAEFLKLRRAPPTGVTPDYPYVSQSVTLEHGSMLLVYTDGVTEAQRADLHQYGEARLLKFAAQQTKTGVKALVSALQADVDRFVAGAEQSDDITIMAMTCSGSTPV